MKQLLQTNFVDDILSDSMGGKRRFNLIPNDDGTYSLEDVTEYDQLGSQFGSANINATNNAVNESADKNKILETLAEINATTEKGYMADALAVKELNNSLNDLFVIKQYVNLPITLVANESGYADVIVPDYTECLAQGYYVGFVLSAFVYSTSVRSNPIGTAPNSVTGSLRILYDNLGSETSASVRVTLIYVKQNKVITV